MSNPPPSSYRYCRVCEMITKFHYNRAIGHSCCDDCGSNIGNIKVELLTRLEHKVIVEKNAKRKTK